MRTLRNSLGVWGMDEELASESICLLVGLTPVNLIVTKSSALKNFIVIKDLEQYSSSRLQSTIKLLWTMNIYSTLYYQAMSTTTTISHAKIQSDLSERDDNNTQRYFALCNSCFWCASYMRRVNTVRCPSCRTEIIESMPIRLDERFLFQYDRKSGVSLQFLIV